MSPTSIRSVNVFSLVCLMLMSCFATAQNITAADYVEMDLQARQVTLEGVRNRLTLLELGGDLEQQQLLDTETQAAVNEIYLQHNMTPAQAITWATDNQVKIAQWMSDNLQIQAEYTRIANELETLSQQIQTLAAQ